jgi:hypothetical protein
VDGGLCVAQEVEHLPRKQVLPKKKKKEKKN